MRAVADEGGSVGLSGAMPYTVTIVGQALPLCTTVHSAAEALPPLPAVPEIPTVPPTAAPVS